MRLRRVYVAREIHARLLLLLHQVQDEHEHALSISATIVQSKPTPSVLATCCTSMLPCLARPAAQSDAPSR